MIALPGLSGALRLARDVRRGALVTGVAAISLAGCASQPAPRATATAQPVPAATLAATTPTPTQAPAKATAHFPGYTKVKVNGETKFCRQETATGSRVSQRTICLTEAQLRQQALDNVRAMEHMNENQLPAADGASVVQRGSTIGR